MFPPSKNVLVVVLVLEKKAEDDGENEDEEFQTSNTKRRFGPPSLNPNYSAFAAEVTLIVSPSRAPSRTTLSPINDFTFSAPSSLNTFLSLS